MGGWYPEGLCRSAWWPTARPWTRASWFSWVRVHRGTKMRGLSWDLGPHPGLKPLHGGGGRRKPAGSWGLHRMVSGSPVTLDQDLYLNLVASEHTPLPPPTEPSPASLRPPFSEGLAWIRDGGRTLASPGPIFGCFLVFSATI